MDESVVVYDDSHVNLILCWSCGVFEIMHPDSYQVCFECKHVYNTHQDLERAYTRVVTEMNAEAIANNRLFDVIPVYKPAEEIFFCQECVHDF